MVATWAKQHQIKIFTPKDANQLREVFAQQKFSSKFGVLADYGVIIPEKVLENFPLGIINIHYSLLPKLRGANPVRAAILENHTKTGVSLMRLSSGIDTGGILAQKIINIPSDITAVELKSKLTTVAIDLLNNKLSQYLQGKIQLQNQKNLGEHTYAGKISKSAGEIDWSKPADKLEREIRAYLGWPGSYTTLAGKQVTITAAHVEKKPISIRSTVPGVPIVVDKSKLAINTGNGTLFIDKLKPAGKNEISAQQFINGYLRNG